MTMLGRGKRSGDKARKAEEAAQRAEELAEQARKAAEEARAALKEAEEERSAEPAEKAARPRRAKRTRDTVKPKYSTKDDDSGTTSVAVTETVADAPAEAPEETREDEAEAKETVALTKAPAGEEATKVDEVQAPEEAETSADLEDAEAPTDLEEVEETEDDQDAVDEDEETPVAKRRIVVRAGLGVSGVILLAVSVALGAALVWLWVQNGRIDATDEARKQVAFAAAQAAQDMSSYDYRTVDSDLRRATEHTTGKFREEFTAQVERVKATARKEQTVTEGVVLKTGIEEISGSRAVALVFLNQETAKTATVERLPHHYTLRLTMKKVDGRWLVEKLQLL